MSRILNRIERGAEAAFLAAIGVKRAKSVVRRQAPAKGKLAAKRPLAAKGEGVIEGGREDLADGRIALWVPRRLYNEQSSRFKNEWAFWSWENDFRDRTFQPMLQAFMRGVEPERVNEVWFVQVTPKHERYRFDSDNGMRACKRSMRDPIARYFGRDDADHMPDSLQWQWGWTYGAGFGVLVLFGGECMELAEPVDGHIYVPRADGSEIAITYRKRL